MAVDLDEARPGDRGIIAALLDEYLHELAGHREVAVGAIDSRSYPYLDAYFSKPGRGIRARSSGAPRPGAHGTGGAPAGVARGRRHGVRASRE
jgi:hypothetical protein